MHVVGVQGTHTSLHGFQQVPCHEKATNLPQVPKGHHQTNPVMGISGSLGRLWPHHNVGRAAAWGC